MSNLFSRLSAKLVTFSQLKTKFYRSCILALFTNFSAVAAMLPIMAKLSVILKSECVNTWEFLHSLGKELKEMIIVEGTWTKCGTETKLFLNFYFCI